MIEAASNPQIRNSSQMTLDEAYKILNVGKESTYEEIGKRFEHLFKLNTKERGSSFYLQSKIVRARERIEQEIQNKNKA